MDKKQDYHNKNSKDTAKRMVLRKPNKNIIKKSQLLKQKRFNLDNYSVKLQKALAFSGLGSRRKMEDLISNNKVKVNGKLAKIGDRITIKDKVSIDEKNIRIIWPDRLPRIILYFKKEGEIVTRKDPKGRTTVFERLPQLKDNRWINIGRLDINTAGLLIFTTSGNLVNRFAHPSFAIDREYKVRINGDLTDEQMHQLTHEGIILDDGSMVKAAYIAEINSNDDSTSTNKWYSIIIQEGKNREIRRIFAKFSLDVSKLIRIRFGPIALPPRLRKGQFYELNELEVDYVLKQIDK